MLSEENQRSDALELTRDPAWLVQEVGYDPLVEGGIESRFTISNGFLGVRGVPAICGEERWISSPYTSIAGLFDTSVTLPHIPVLVSAPDWVGVTLLVNGAPLIRSPDDMATHQRTLDMKRGALVSSWHPAKAGGAVVRLCSSRLVSLVDRGVGLQILSLRSADRLRSRWKYLAWRRIRHSSRYSWGRTSVSGASVNLQRASPWRPLPRCGSTAER